MVFGVSGDITMRLFRVFVRIMWMWGEILIILLVGIRIFFKERIGIIFRKRF